MTDQIDISAKMVLSAESFWRSNGYGNLADMLLALRAALDAAEAREKRAVEAVIYTVHDRGNVGICIGGRWHGWTMIRHPDGHWVSDHLAGKVDPSQTGDKSVLAAAIRTGAKP